jgi:hypothetical protein
VGSSTVEPRCVDASAINAGPGIASQELQHELRTSAYDDNENVLLILSSCSHVENDALFQSSI